MSIRLGRIPYLNSEVFYQGFPLDLVELADHVPRELSRAARQGRIDVGPVPIVTCFELEDQFTPLGSFGIAVKNQARSVLLFSKRPIEDLGGATVALTGESSTSVRLVRILLEDRFGVHPASYVSTQQPRSDAILLIGDAALNNRTGLPSYPRVYDLGELWKEWTGLSFVFARWIVRRDLNPEARTLLERLLAQSLERGLRKIDEIAARRTDLSMTTEEVRDYLLGFNYVLGDSEEESIALFRKHIEAHDARAQIAESHEGARSSDVHAEPVREAPNAG